MEFKNSEKKNPQKRLKFIRLVKFSTKIPKIWRRKKSAKKNPVKKVQKYKEWPKLFG